MTKVLEGGCLCRKVRYRAKAEPMMVGNCYCVDCRKSSATSHSTHVLILEDALTVDGVVAMYDHPADSGNVVARGFCPQCGSAILSRNSSMPGVTFLRASSLDDMNTINPQMSVYTSRAPAWAQIDPGIPAFAEMPEGGPQSILAQR